MSFYNALRLLLTALAIQYTPYTNIPKELKNDDAS